MVAHLWTLRRMSLSIAGMLQAGETPNLEAALVKDLGNALRAARSPSWRACWCPAAAATRATQTSRRVLAADTYACAVLDLRGGTREILRGIIARGLGLR